jgi:phospholipase C
VWTSPSCALGAWFADPHGNILSLVQRPREEPLVSGRISRRRFLRSAGAALAALPAGGRLLTPDLAAAAVRRPGSLPDPTRPAGTPTAALPFDHLVVVMMENHSFDNVLGALARSGQPRADGLTFDAAGHATNSNPGPAGPVPAFAFPSTVQGPKVSQTWNSTHRQIDGGRMDGFVRSVGGARQPMGYWTASVLPFPYSLARTFTVANRWFGSAPCQTYPNRRFLLAGTAYGGIATNVAALADPPPPNGTIFDRLHAHGISWRNYFSDVPQTAIIPQIVRRYPHNLASVARFRADCRSGSLPAVSFVDPPFGSSSEASLLLSRLPILATLGARAHGKSADEEAPQDLGAGENWAHAIVEAVLRSPAWPRTLLVYLYDEHGGYYDHVPPPAAIAPDSIAPRLAPGDAPGGYTIYGPRVPAVVVSPYSKPNAVTDVVHDHTSILATIEAKWNLPALTFRDANAATVADFLDPGHAAFLEPPALAAPLPAS